MPDKKAHLCTKKDLLVLDWDPKCKSRKVTIKGTYETCMTGPGPGSSSRTIQIHVRPAILSEEISVKLSIHSLQKGAPVFKMDNMIIQPLEAVTQITSMASISQPSIVDDAVYLMTYKIKFKK